MAVNITQFDDFNSKLYRLIEELGHPDHIGLKSLPLPTLAFFWRVDGEQPFTIAFLVAADPEDIDKYLQNPVPQSIKAAGVSLTISPLALEDVLAMPEAETDERKHGRRGGILGHGGFVGDN